MYFNNQKNKIKEENVQVDIDKYEKNRVGKNGCKGNTKHLL